MRIAFLMLIFIAADESTRADDLILSTNFEHTDVNLFVPEGVKIIRGVLINPADKNVAGNGVWRESCRHWGMAFMGIMLENVDKRNNRPNTIKRVIAAALAEFAEKSKHPELINAPFVFGGMSKGGGWSAELGQNFASRTIVFNNVCGWVGKPEKDLSMPAVIIIGGVPDGFKMLDSIAMQFEPARKKGADWCLALQWGNAHNYGNANALAFPFLDAVIAARLPKDADPAAGLVKLQSIKAGEAWLGDRSTWETNYATIAPQADFKGDREIATWLPNRYVAFVWRSFVSKSPPVQLDVSSADGKIAAARFKPTEKRFVIVASGSQLKLTADVSPDVRLKTAALFDGDIPLGKTDAPPYVLDVNHLPPGPRSLFIEYTLGSGQVGVSNPVLVVVIQSK